MAKAKKKTQDPLEKTHWKSADQWHKHVLIPGRYVGILDERMTKLIAELAEQLEQRPVLDVQKPEHLTKMGFSR